MGVQQLLSKAGDADARDYTVQCGNDADVCDDIAAK